jgi:hypothetical protein
VWFALRQRLDHALGSAEGAESEIFNFASFGRLATPTGVT